MNAIRRRCISLVRGITATISFLFRLLGGRRMLTLIARVLPDTFLHESTSALFRRSLLGAFLILTLTALVYETVYRGGEASSTAARAAGETIERAALAYEGIGGPTLDSIGSLEFLPSLPGEDGEGDVSGVVVSGNVLEAPAISVTRLENRLRDSIEEYVVQEGDTLGGIAERFGISVETILWENKLTARTLIRPGNTLRILPTSGLSHVVARGETLASIAKKYKVEERDILGFNEVSEASKIAVGLKLIIPEATPPVVIRPSTPNSRQTGPNTPPPGAIVRGKGLLMPSRYKRISQWFTWRHSGVDMAGDSGTPIWAADDGIVVRSGWGTGYGLHVLIDHGNGLMTRYGHASKLYAQKGERVKKGDTIALMGSTGRSTGPHLHFETILNGRFVNPTTYVKF